MKRGESLMSTQREREDAAYRIGHDYRNNCSDDQETATANCPYGDIYLRNCWLRGWQDAHNEILNSYD
jgi:ribosome modulation factor